MFIQTETTPNPLTLKFIPGVPVLDAGTAFYTDKSAASESPLALALFDIANVNAVFLGSDFITVTRAEQSSWETLKPAVLTTIMEHFVSGRKTVNTGSKTTSNGAGEEDSEIVKQIIELIDTRVRPAVAQDGGDIIYRSFENGIVKLELHGSCSGCPSSTMTLKNGIENMLRHYVPEVIAVEAVA
ncbi:MAG TPA: NifU family protein [Rickettsiales bacterium]|nr:NifU family protein [Rickettsiales bacterium]